MSGAGADGSIFATTRLILESSAIRLSLVWRRPAVSMMTQSRPRLLASLDGVEGDGGRVGAGLVGDEFQVETGRPGLELVDGRCSNVSQAARRTVPPSCVRRQPSFAAVVVFPEPLTPMSAMTVGRGGGPGDSTLRAGEGALQDLGADLGRLPALKPLVPARRGLDLPRISAVVSTPKSAA
jgi:hypothetical protein